MSLFLYTVLYYLFSGTQGLLRRYLRSTPAAPRNDGNRSVIARNESRDIGRNDEAIPLHKSILYSRIASSRPTLVSLAAPRNDEDLLSRSVAVFVFLTASAGAGVVTPDLIFNPYRLRFLDLPRIFHRHTGGSACQLRRSGASRARATMPGDHRQQSGNSGRRVRPPPRRGSGCP